MTFQTKSAPDTILIKGEAEVNYQEKIAGGTITPGHLIMLDSNGKYVVSTNTTTEGEKLFAREDELQGNEISDDYSSGDRVLAFTAKPGYIVYAWLDAGETVVIGDKLKSAGNGKLAKHTSVVPVIGIALEALDLSDSGDVATRIKIEIV